MTTEWLTLAAVNDLDQLSHVLKDWEHVVVIDTSQVTFTEIKLFIKSLCRPTINEGIDRQTSQHLNIGYMKTGKSITFYMYSSD